LRTPALFAGVRSGFSFISAPHLAHHGPPMIAKPSLEIVPHLGQTYLTWLVSCCHSLMSPTDVGMMMAGQAGATYCIVWEIASWIRLLTRSGIWGAK
jgi:hypothetical protein